ncbi:oxidoreductase [Lactobacillus hominis DSM 23910 = CRBIP 24.179]|uniref:Putative oxidoreductase n=1 Tax=Lactobacillus hominis DSM 23910 = CRBIP 24.179 TaxID=1423758 RepID=I7KHF4_9LACO|nr:oxidoreductase [Lactobacillus hominis DSM 23910 = CRBIP 24.179]CCI82085.1 Putative oxidoreductase [Lactobacillus hominis DSM 23910 = CRBIP 24.179]
MINLGIVGSGMIVHDFLSIADQVPDLNLAAISTTKRSEKIGQELAQKYNITKTYTDNEQLYNDSNVNTVYVAVPNNLHYDVAKAALLAGNNVICEKPFVDTPEQARELKQIADEKGVFLVEAITNIYLANFAYLKAHLDQIGPIHDVALNYTQYSSRYDDFLKGIIKPVFDPAKDGGALMDIGIYNIHLAVGLFGKPKTVHYFPVMQKDIDTSGTLMLSYDGMQASLLAAKDSYVTDQWSYIEGEKGTLKIKGSIGQLNEIELDLKGKEPKKVDLNKYNDRMVAEFVEFSRMFKQKDKVAADKAFDHSLATLEVLYTAKKQK